MEVSIYGSIRIWKYPYMEVPGRKVHNALPIITHFSVIVVGMGLNLTNYHPLICDCSEDGVKPITFSLIAVGMELNFTNYHLLFDCSGIATYSCIRPWCSYMCVQNLTPFSLQTL